MKRLIDIINEKLKLADVKQNNYYLQNEYFYHEALEDGYTIKFTETKNILQYSIDNCQTWHDLEPGYFSETPTINKGQRIYFKGENMKITNNRIGQFESNKKFNVGGNIMSIIYGDNFEKQTELLEDHQFRYLFFENKYLVSAKDLVLPATKLSEYCYDCMFYNCKLLNEAPELPATELSNGCYDGMFILCASLIEAPKLPATKLAYGCYDGMFNKCSSLIKAPELPATKLYKKCYWRMFEGCKSLNEITMLATDISAYDCLHEWVVGVSNTGTFTKAKGVDIPTGWDGIPKGWNVKEI